MCSNSEAFHSLRACAVLVVGVAGTMPVHGIGTACFLVQVGGSCYIMRIHNCLFCHGEDSFNLLSVSQMLRTGRNEVVFSQDHSRLCVGRGDGNAVTIPLNQKDGLYELKVTPVYLGEERLYGNLPCVDITMDDDPRLWDEEKPRTGYSKEPMEYAGMRAPSKLGVWHCRMLWTSCKALMNEVREYDSQLNEFCDSYFAPPSQPATRKTYRTRDVNDMADLSLRFMGVGTDRLKHTLERSRGLTPASRKKGESVRVVPPHHFPQGKWKTGKTPRVTKNRVKNLHKASIAEVCFTDTFETDDSTFRYGQAIVDYRSRYGDIIPIRTRKKVGWAIGEFCCRHFVPLILVRDNIQENVGGEMEEECHRRGIKSAFSCPYTPQQDYAEGYLGRVIAMASFAMVFSGAPIFMWRWAIQCAVFINNITATFFRKERVWATPWELLHGEPFPDSSVVVPFGCAALVLLNKEDREKFKGTCAMMIFVHYAQKHPLYTYALFSPRSKRIVYRQDVIFLPNVFPMREARLKGGLMPDGEALVAYRSPSCSETKRESELSFGSWKDDDPLPPFQDHTTGYALQSPDDDTGDSAEERPPDWPRQRPSHPSFGPESVVSVPLPWKDEHGESQRLVEHTEMGSEEPGRSETAAEDKVSRPKRNVKASKPPPETSKRRPVGQRWFYEPVAPPKALMAVSNETGESSVGSKGRDEQGNKRLLDPLLAIEQIFLPEQSLEIELGQSRAVDPGMTKLRKKENFHVSERVGQLKGRDRLVSEDEKMENRHVSFGKTAQLSTFTSNNNFEHFSGKRTCPDNFSTALLSNIGPTEPIPYEQFGTVSDDDSSAWLLLGMLFLEDELGWCIVTDWGADYGTNIVYYASVNTTDPASEEHHASVSAVLELIRQSPSVSRETNYRASRRLSALSCKKTGMRRLLSAKRLQPAYGTTHVRKVTGLINKVQMLPTRVLRKILKAQETLFKYGTLIPRSDQEANSSPEAIRWKSGRQLEWLRLLAAKTFETDWTWERIRKEYPEYQRSEIGHMFYVYDYKYSGEHRVRLVFDGSRQSPNTYNVTYAPTVRAESVRLFHLYAVEYGWDIQQYDVPQAFLRSDADCTIFVYPPNGQSDFPGQILKLSKMLYGSKQAAALWYNLLNSFLLKLGFTASIMDPCFYRRTCMQRVGTDEARSDAIIILHVDDMRVAACPAVLKSIHDQLFQEFQITTSDSGRFLGMDTEYNIKDGFFKMHMATYIDSTVQRFSNFDLSKGIPYRELVGSLMWIVLCVMGTELLRVKDLARRSNNYTMDDYTDALKVLERITSQRGYGIIFRRGGAGREYIPACTRLGGGSDDMESGYSIGDSTEINELEETNLYKLDPLVDDVSLDLKKTLADTNTRFTKVAYTDASFAVGETKQSISGFVILINGTPILWGSLKQTIVVDSTCSAEYVAASVCCKQILQAENMVQFLDFTCPRPYTMYTDSQACLKIATTSSKMGMVRHLEIRYHLVRCIVLSGDIKLSYCITEEMLADLLTKIVATAQDKRLAIRFYNDCVMD